MEKSIWEELFKMDKELSDEAISMMMTALETLKYEDVKTAIITIYKQGFREGIGVAHALVQKTKENGTLL